MIEINPHIEPVDLLPAIENCWELSAAKIRSIEKRFDPAQGAPVFTVEGKYSTRGWTDWTQGFQVGSHVLQFDATDDRDFLDSGRAATRGRMAEHLTHIGVHDHGFNNVSTYGNLLRLMNEGRLPENPWEREFYQTALKVSGAVQAARWTPLPGELGYIHSFNGPHSLFADTIRSLRALAVGWKLGHDLLAENDRRISLLERLITHARTTTRYIVFFGEDRDAYDLRGRVVHEAIFNTTDGAFRCPSTQQGYSPFSTWTRGLAWIMLGYPEELEFLAGVDDQSLEPFGGREEVERFMLETARAACDFYIANTPTDGVPYWDTGAPGLAQMGDYLDAPSNPFNDHEPVDSSAAAIGAQGLLRLGNILEKQGEDGSTYRQAGLTVLETLLGEPYLSASPHHEGLLLHSVYHRPNGWDHIPAGRKVPCGESCLWGDYHLRELALYVQRIAKQEPYLQFSNVTD